MIGMGVFATYEAYEHHGPWIKMAMANANRPNTYQLMRKCFLKHKSCTVPRLLINAAERRQ